MSVHNTGSIYTDSITTTSANIPVTVESYSNHDDENADYKPNNGGYVRLDNRPTSFLSVDKLKYPKNIDPYKVRREIFFTVVICILIITIVGITFVKCFLLGTENKIENKSLIIHGFLCCLMLISCLLLVAFFMKSHYWIDKLMNSGFYSFPVLLKKRRTIVVLIWSAGIFFFNVPLVLEYHYCAAYKTLVNCTGALSGYNFLQIYVGGSSMLVIIAMVYYLVALVKFRIERRWPDIWHERLLEESSLIESCPLIKTCELRIEDHENTIMSSINPNNVPTEEEIMKIQAYVIKYLRQLNNQLSERICQLHNRNNRQYNNYGSTLISDPREHLFNPSISVIPSNPHQNNRC